MQIACCRIAAILLLAGMSVAAAAPNIPPSELPGRERERFRESPLDRFTQPSPSAVPRFEIPRSARDCQSRSSRHSKQRGARSKRC